MDPLLSRSSNLLKSLKKLKIYILEVIFENPKKILNVIYNRHVS